MMRVCQVCCSVLQCVAVCCSVLQYAISDISYMMRVGHVRWCETDKEKERAREEASVHAKDSKGNKETKIENKD